MSNTHFIPSSMKQAMNCCPAVLASSWPKKMMKKHSSARIMLNRIITRCEWRKESEGLTKKTTIHGWLVRNHMKKSNGHASILCRESREVRAVVSIARTWRYHAGM